MRGTWQAAHGRRHTAGGTRQAVQSGSRPAAAPVGGRTAPPPWCQTAPPPRAGCWGRRRRRGLRDRGGAPPRWGQLQSGGRGRHAFGVLEAGLGQVSPGWHACKAKQVAVGQRSPVACGHLAMQPATAHAAATRRQRQPEPVPPRTVPLAVFLCLLLRGPAADADGGAAGVPRPAALLLATGGNGQHRGQQAPNALLEGCSQGAMRANTCVQCAVCVQCASACFNAGGTRKQRRGCGAGCPAAHRFPSRPCRHGSAAAPQAAPPRRACHRGL